MPLNKIWNKFTNRQRYMEIKHIEENKKHITSFQKKHEIEINLIQKKIKDQKKLNFLHSGHAADIINVLPVIKKLSQEHECNLYININKPIKFYFHSIKNLIFFKDL